MFQQKSAKFTAALKVWSITLPQHQQFSVIAIRPWLALHNPNSTQSRTQHHFKNMSQVCSLQTFPTESQYFQQFYFAGHTFLKSQLPKVPFYCNNIIRPMKQSETNNNNQRHNILQLGCWSSYCYTENKQDLKDLLTLQWPKCSPWGQICRPLFSQTFIS